MGKVLMKIMLSIFYFFFYTVIFSQCEKPLRIHSHNDYDNPIPLYNALENCAKSIEADIHLVNGKLLVGHDLSETDSTITLEKLYLKPLIDIIEKSNSKYKFGYELFLLIDIKSDSDSTLSYLSNILEKYNKYLTYYQNGTLYERKIRIIISGNRPIKLISNLEFRNVFLDGRLSDLGKNYSSDLYPLISDSEENVKEFIGIDRNDFIQSEEFELLVEKIHAENKCIRLWGISDNETSWKNQLDKGVDLVNTDYVKELSSFSKANYCKD